MNLDQINLKSNAQQIFDDSHKRASKAGIIIGGVISLLIIGFLTGLLQFGVATVGCGKWPVAATNFSAADSFELPGEFNYGPNPFNQYFCTRQAAEHAGFIHSTATDLGKKEDEARIQAAEKAKVSEPSKP